MPGLTALTKQGYFDADVMNAVNTNAANTPGIVTTAQQAAALATGFGSAITLLPAGHPAGTYRITIYGVVTTTITTATSWLFTLAFTDDKQAQTPTVTTSSTMTAGTAQTGTQTIRSTGATALTYTPTAASAGAGVVAYSVVVERVI